MSSGGPDDRLSRPDALHRGPDDRGGTSGSLLFDIAAGTDVGRRREVNQDAALAYLDPEHRCAVLAVCDGLGGLEGGEIAAATTVERIRFALAECETRPETCLERGLLEAHRAVREASGLRRMGTTVAAVLLGPEGFAVVHVGDSRVYLLRRGVLEALTIDHSWVMEQVAAGRMTVEQAERDSRRNIVTRALGTDTEVGLEWRSREAIRPADVFLACSDGLHGVVPAREIAAILEGPFDAEMAVQALIMRANQLGGPDNIGVAVARVEAAGG